MNEVTLDIYFLRQIDANVFSVKLASLELKVLLN